MTNIKYWNYRVVRRAGEVAIYEAYYDDDGNVRSLTLDPVSPSSEDPATLKERLELMLEAFDKSVVEFDQVNSDS